MLLSELLERLIRDRDVGARTMQNKLVIGVERLSTSIGGQPSIPIVGMYHGFDWEDGYTFLKPDRPIRAASDAFRKEQAMAREMADQLGWIWLVLRNKDMSSDQKIRAIQSQFNRDRARRKRQAKVA